MGKKRNSRFLDALVGWPALWILNALGRLTWQGTWRYGALLGRTLYRVDSRRRKITLRNLEKAFSGELGETERLLLAKQSFENLGRFFLETAKMSHISAEDLEGRFEVENGQILKQVYDEGRGVVVVCAHLGNWEIMARTFGSWGYRYAVIYRPIDNRFLDEKMRESRLVGGEIIPREAMFKSVRSALKEGKIVAFMSDQNAGKKGIFVPFFGVQASTTPAAAIFAQATGAPIVPVFCFRLGPGRFRSVIHHPIWAEGGKDRKEEQQELTEAFTLEIEKAVRRCPDQWFWMHRRWRTRPQEERTVD